MSSPFATELHRTPELIALESIPLMVVRHTGKTLADLRELFDSAFTTLGAAMGAGALTPVGPGLAVYQGDPTAVFDIEIGFPVAEAGAESTVNGVTIEPSEIPAGHAVALTHLGSYDGLGETWGQVMTAVANESLPMPPTRLVEIYVSQPSPTVDPATLRTDLWAHEPN